VKGRTNPQNFLRKTAMPPLSPIGPESDDLELPSASSASNQPLSNHHVHPRRQLFRRHRHWHRPCRIHLRCVSACLCPSTPSLSDVPSELSLRLASESLISMPIHTMAATRLRYHRRRPSSGVNVSQTANNRPLALTLAAPKSFPSLDSTRSVSSLQSSLQ